LIGTLPSAHRIGRSSGDENRPSRAANRTRRRQVVEITTGSTSEFGWFPTKITGPTRGT